MSHTKVPLRRRRVGRPTAVLATLTVALSLLTVQPTHAAAPSVPSAESSALTVRDLTVNDQQDPMGIDDVTPTLSWQLDSVRRNQMQSAYQIQAASRADLLTAGEPDLWDTGKVVSSRSINVEYGGKVLDSRQPVFWRVRAWDQRDRASAWSEPGRWEVGLLDEKDWSAQWIGNPRWEEEMQLHPIVVKLPEQSARYVRLDVTRLVGSYLQLGEIVVQDSDHPSVNLAQGARVTASEQFSSTQRGVWEPVYLTDGLRHSSMVPRGYSSVSHPAGPLADPIQIQLDLSEVRHFDELLMYPRTDYFAGDGSVDRVPRDFTVGTATTEDGPFDVVKSVTDQQPPAPAAVPEIPLPDFARQFDLDGDVESARLYVTGLGVYEATVNGERVSDAVLEPDYTDYNKRVVYQTYDVTSLLDSGENAIGIRLGNGYYNVSFEPERSAFRLGWGPPKLLAQLEVTLADGRTRTIASDETWSTRLGATTGSNWWGGEDFDARRVQPGWDQPGADLESWSGAVATAPPMPDTALSARSDPSIEPVDTLTPVQVTEPKDGVYVFDFGVNFAGWEELHVEGPAGTRITMRPAELLKPDGTVNQIEGSMGGDVWDSYTLSGDGQEVWHPDFVYHGFRYVQVEGLPYEPTSDTVRGIVLRTANERAGSFSTSDKMLGDIHRIIDRAVQNNMYSVMTDCPNREKRGWLEEDQLIYGVLARNYDVAAFSRKIVRDISESLTPEGLVRNTAPSSSKTSDPNWGGALVLMPWRMYETYGDVTTLRTYYPVMETYMGALADEADGHLMTSPNAYGDWGAVDTTTPVGLATSYGYLRLANAMSDIAEVLGKDADASRYARLAADIAAAFNAEYFHPDRDTYATGSQAAHALALDLGIVPEGHRQAVLEHLVASIQDAGNRYTVGEVALPALLRVLSRTGHDELIYEMAVQAGSPGYGFALVNGATALPSYPISGRMLTNSQAHWMMGALDEWFTGNLAGIQQAPSSVAFERLVIDPAVVGQVASADGSYDTPYGTVRSAWRRDDRSFRLEVTVPVNATAMIHVPLFGGEPRPAPDGARFEGVRDGDAVYEVGSGDWHFVSITPDTPSTYGGRIALSVPEGAVSTRPDSATTATVTAHNLTDRDITLTPSVSTTDGFGATAADDSVVVPAHGSTEVAVDVRRDGEAATVQGVLTVAAEDRSVDIPLIGTGTLARSATMTASSSHPAHPAATANDGDISGQYDYAAWSAGQGWNDNTSGQFPDTLTATWDEPVQVSGAVMYTMNDSAHSASRYGLRDYDVQVRSGGAWQTVATVRSNTWGTVLSDFPTVTTDALRLVIHETNDRRYSRVIELEAY